MTICSICKLEIQPDANGWDGTNNAYPINDGRCCHDCNRAEVVPARIRTCMDYAPWEETDAVNS